MPIRELFRGSVNEEQLAAIVDELARRVGGDPVDVDRLEAANWLSTPYVVDDEWFVKVISPRNALIHALFTAGRNVGAFASGVEGFFEHHADAVAMAEHERDATAALRAAGVPGPDPVDAFGVGDHGVLVLEYLPAVRSIRTLDSEAVAELAPAIFRDLAVAHAAGVVHGDLQAENVLVLDGEPAFIDATSVRDDPTALADARAYDVASGLGTLEPLIGARPAVVAAAEHFDDETLLAALDFVEFVALRPELDFDTGAVKSEIERIVA